MSSSRWLEKFGRIRWNMKNLHHPKNKHVHVTTYFWPNITTGKGKKSAFPLYHKYHKNLTSVASYLGWRSFWYKLQSKNGLRIMIFHKKCSWWGPLYMDIKIWSQWIINKLRGFIHVLKFSSTEISKDDVWKFSLKLSFSESECIILSDKTEEIWELWHKYYEKKNQNTKNK